MPTIASPATSGLSPCAMIPIVSFVQPDPTSLPMTEVSKSMVRILARVRAGCIMANILEKIE